MPRIVRRPAATEPLHHCAVNRGSRCAAIQRRRCRGVAQNGGVGGSMSNLEQPHFGHQRSALHNDGSRTPIALTSRAVGKAQSTIRKSRAPLHRQLARRISRQAHGSGPRDIPTTQNPMLHTVGSDTIGQYILSSRTIRAVDPGRHTETHRSHQSPGPGLMRPVAGCC